jgi:hypothetical protein
MNRPVIQRLLVKHEAWRNITYDDATGKNVEPGVPLVGNPTNAVGFNLARADAKQVFAQLGIPNFNSVLQGLEPLTDPQVQQLLDFVTDEVIGIGQALLPNFDSLPDDIQAVVCDMAMMGRHSLAGFTGFLGALRAYNYPLAAAEAKNSDWCVEVKSRCVDDCAILNGGTIQ